MKTAGREAAGGYRAGELYKSADDASHGAVDPRDDPTFLSVSLLPSQVDQKKELFLLGHRAQYGNESNPFKEATEEDRMKVEETYYDLYRRRKVILQPTGLLPASGQQQGHGVDVALDGIQSDTYRVFGLPAVERRRGIFGAPTSGGLWSSQPRSQPTFGQTS